MFNFTSVVEEIKKNTYKFTNAEITQRYRCILFMPTHIYSIYKNIKF